MHLPKHFSVVRMPDMADYIAVVKTFRGGSNPLIPGGNVEVATSKLGELSDREVGNNRQVKFCRSIEVKRHLRSQLVGRSAVCGVVGRGLARKRDGAAAWPSAGGGARDRAESDDKRRCGSVPL